MAFTYSDITKKYKRWAAKEDEITLSGWVSLERNSAELIEEFERIFRYAKSKAKSSSNKKAVIIDLCNVEFLYPCALIFILAFAETLKKDVSVRFKLQLNGHIHEFLWRAGFGNIFNLAQFPQEFRSHFKEGKVLSLETGSEIVNTRGKGEWFADRLSEVRPLGITLDAQTISAIDEILKNVRQHSKFTTWFGIGQAYPTSRRVRLAFYDNGQGIKSHIAKLKYSKQHIAFRSEISRQDYLKMQKTPANFAIKKAAIECVSGTDYKDNSGAGLDFLVNKFAREPDDLVTILSEDGLVIWKQGKIICDLALPFSIQGTIVALTAGGLE